MDILVVGKKTYQKKNPQIAGQQWLMVVLHIPCLKGLQQKHHKKTTKQAKEAVVLVKRSKSNCAMVNKSPGTGSKSNRDNSQPDVAAVLFFFPGSFPSKRKDAFFFPMLFSDNHHFQLEIHLQLHLWWIFALSC